MIKTNNQIFSNSVFNGFQLFNFNYMVITKFKQELLNP